MADQILLAEILALALTARGFEVHVQAGAGPCAPPLLRSILAVRPHVVLLHLDPGCGDHAQLIRGLTRSGCAVMVVTADNERCSWGGFLHHGARGIFATSRPLAELVRAVQDIGAGRRLLDDAEYCALLKEWRTGATEAEERRSRLARLTRREQEILHELMEGHAVRDIAEGAVVTEGTVRKQVCAVLSKLGVSTQVAAIGLAHRAGWRPAAAADARASETGRRTCQGTSRASTA